MIARHERVVIDIGTGTGQSVLRRARREPNTLVIGVDAEASAMADASRSAAANLKKGGLPNVLFLVEVAERLPGPLAATAGLVTVALPWGSLLRGIVEVEAGMATALRDLLKPTGELLLFLSEIDRPRVDALTSKMGWYGFHTVEARQADESDVKALSSGWARRLGIPGSRPAWIIRLQR